MRHGSLLRVRPADADAANHIADRLRAWDLIELVIARASTEDIVRWAAMPGTLVMEAPDGEPIAIGGIHDAPAFPGCIWLLGTDRIDAFGRAFVRTLRRDMWRLEEWELVQNIVPAERHETIRWLTSMGFDFGPAFVHSSGIPVRAFRRERHAARRGRAAPR